MDARILFQDDHLLVAYKPYDVLSESHDSRPNMPAILCELSGGEIYPVHRLDRTTQGLMVYARDSKTAAALSESIRSGMMTKSYLAATEGVTDDGGELRDLLYYDRARNKSYVVKRERKGVKEAILRYERLAVSESNGREISLIRVDLITGRTHQIRVQFASRRHPLVGDRRYGSSIQADHIALCCSELSLPHPVTGEELRFAYTPNDGSFATFDVR